MEQQETLFGITDRVILVTGAAGGLGSAIVRALAAQDARVIVTDIDGARAEALASECGAEARTLDIRDEGAVEAVLGAVLEAHGRLDGLINAAGIYRIAPIAEMATTDFAQSMETNFTGAFFLTRAAAKAMGEKGGRILHLASVSSLVANADYVAYASSKAALSQMVRVAARELASKGITVNAIGPAVTDTPLIAAHLADPAFRANAIAQIPMGRLGTPQDIIAPVILLMAPGGAFITGQTIYVDGGRTLV
jgi:NAD(P)-dependent dehydrogenase (short-subunit alcohol dehydrogenase family)